MLYFLRLGVLFFVVVSSSAQCYFERFQVGVLPLQDKMNRPEGCVDSEGSTHVFGSEWVTADCFNCVCSGFGISCCNKIPTAIELPAECKLVVDKTTCSYTIAMASDPIKPCIAK
ncbi:beta-microseminoprotein [Triplophysa dalaica]|uniref:beta-microseminoprotein n=1 Tax=Triplophysa dalaica TaxID=1582913 RepID=UPI0024DF47DC|nr:beta-microseminoprotein [Triplophysa dalaica]